MVYPIVVYGDSVLKKKCRLIKKGEIDVIEITQDLFETLTAASGIGLAAPQIGKDLRIFVVDGSPLEEEDMQDFKKVFINPIIEEEQGEQWAFEEGCLSIPEIREEIFRKPKIRITYYDENWNKRKEEFEGMKARIVQHEYDHLEGILFTDYLSAFKKRILRNRLLNISKGKVETEYQIRFPLKK